MALTRGDALARISADVLRMTGVKGARVQMAYLLFAALGFSLEVSAVGLPEP